MPLPFPRPCTVELSWMDPPDDRRKDGRPRVTNRYPATCALCGDRLRPGEGHAGGRNDDGIQWICGAGRWARR